MQGVQSAGRGAGLPAPGVADPPAPDERIDLAGVEFFALTQQRAHLVQQFGVFALDAGQAHLTRMQQLLSLTRKKAVVGQHVLFGVQGGIQPFEVARPVARDPLHQRQILRSGGGTDGVGLHETQRVQGGLKVGLRRQRAKGSGAKGGEVRQAGPRQRSGWPAQLVQASSARCPA